MRCTLPTKMEKSNSKESISLLDMLSESDSDSTDLILAPQKKKKVKRRHKSRILSRTRHSNSCGCNKSDIRMISLWLAAVLITFWLIALSWLATILYSEIKKMDMSIKTGKPLQRDLSQSPTNPQRVDIGRLCSWRESAASRRRASFRDITGVSSTASSS